MGRFKKLTDITGRVDPELLVHGVLGLGVVRDIQPTGPVLTIGIKEHRVCLLSVRVLVEGRPPYVASLRQRVPVSMLVALAGRDHAVAVRVDPLDAKRIVLDLAADPPPRPRTTSMT